MAVQLPGQFANGPDVSGWNGAGDLPRGFPHRPPAPRNVTARSLNVGAVTVRWQDYGPEANWDINRDFLWVVRYCPANVAGVTDPNWTLAVLQRSKIIGSVAAVGQNTYFSINYEEVGLPDGYVQVVGIDGSMRGTPSTPLFINFTGTEKVIPENVYDFLGASFQKIMVPYENLQVTFGYIPPEITTNFGGVHMHYTGYETLTDPRELGPPERWDKSTGSIFFTRNLPLETGAANGTATFTNGSATVNRVSGDNFAVGHIGRIISADLSSTTGSAGYIVNGFASANQITLTTTWAEASGTYTFKVNNGMIFYCVPIGKNGERDDYALAPTADFT